MRFSTQTVKNAEVKTNELNGELYCTAKVNGIDYIGSVFMIDNYICVTSARNINCSKRTTLRIMSAIEKALNN